MDLKPFITLSPPLDQASENEVLGVVVSSLVAWPCSCSWPNPAFDQKDDRQKCILLEIRLFQIKILFNIN